MAMTAPKTLLELSGADLRPPRLRDATLVMIDLQNEYLSGPIALPDATSAINSAANLLARARAAGAAIFHIAHKGRPGGLFDRSAERGAIVATLAPLPGEPVIEKGLPNAFAGTDLETQLAAVGLKDVILAGLMTHMRISSTARAGSISVTGSPSMPTVAPRATFRMDAAGRSQPPPSTKSHSPNCPIALRSLPAVKTPWSDRTNQWHRRDPWRDRQIRETEAKGRHTDARSRRLLHLRQYREALDALVAIGVQERVVILE
jgi:hypothetical protein